MNKYICNSLPSDKFKVYEQIYFQLSCEQQRMSATYEYDFFSSEQTGAFVLRMSNLKLIYMCIYTFPL